MSVDIFFWKPVSVGDDSSQRFEKSGMGVESLNEAADGDAGVWKATETIQSHQIFNCIEKDKKDKAVEPRDVLRQEDVSWKVVGSNPVASNFFVGEEIFIEV